MLLGVDDDDIGIAPLVASILAPIAIKAGGSIIGSVASSLTGGGKAPPPPPCGFMDRLSKVFGGKPKCSG